MRAVRVGAPGRADVVEIADHSVAGDEVEVEVTRASICSTDRKLVARGSDPPLVIGHEAVGRLEDGTLVGIHPDVGCGRCADCEQGLENRCPRGFSMGVDRDGCMAERVAVPFAHAVPLEGIDPEVAPLLEPLACCIHALETLVVASEGALVVGAGPMGILCMWALQAAGSRVVVGQRSPARRALAQELGADAAVAPDEDPAPALGMPPRVAVVTAPGAPALRYALEKVAVGGRVHAFAGTPDGAEIDANLVHYRHLRLVGSTGSTLRDYTRACDLVSAGEIKLERLPRTGVTIEDVPELLTDAPDPLTLKYIVDLKARPR